MSELQIGHQVQTGISRFHLLLLFTQRFYHLQNSFAESRGNNHLEIIHNSHYFSLLILVDMI